MWQLMLGPVSKRWVKTQNVVTSFRCKTAVQDFKATLFHAEISSPHNMCTALTKGFTSTSMLMFADNSRCISRMLSL